MKNEIAVPEIIDGLSATTTADEWVDLVSKHLLEYLGVSLEEIEHSEGRMNGRAQHSFHPRSSPITRAYRAGRGLHPGRRHRGGPSMKTVRWFSFLSRCAVVSLTLAASTLTAHAAGPVKNIVLVHGAFADGSSWSKVISLLQDKGYNVTAVQIPLSSLEADVAATRRALARQDGPAILVGHSWAGVVITEAGTDSKVAGLVYVAAFAPDQG